MKMKKMNRPLCRFLWAGLAILLLFSTVPTFAAAEKDSFFVPASEMPVDEAGYNLRGNIPEQAAMGGFYATQKDWLFFADWTQNGILCAANADGSRKFTLTDFPVANINVKGDTLVFTDLSATVSRRYQADVTLEHLKLTYGGRLYEAQGVKDLMSGGQLGAIQQLGGDEAYYRVVLVESNNIFALSGTADGDKVGTDWQYVHISNGKAVPVITTSAGESIVNIEETSRYGYFEIDAGDEWGSIVRLELNPDITLTSIPGRELSMFGDRIFFISNQNHYLYEIKGDADMPSVVSSCPMASYALQENGDIKALGADGQIELLISLYEGYKGFAGPYQVGEWYNYFKIHYTRPKPEPPDPEEDLISVEYEWIKEPIICYFDPPPPPPPPPLPPPPPPSNRMPPEAAVEMVMTIAKGGTVDDNIFNKYYDANAKKVFLEYFARLFGTQFDLGRIANEAMDAFGEGMFTEEHKEKMTTVFKNYFRQIEYTLETIEETETTAIVRVHLTQSINVDFDKYDVSENALMSHMANYLAQQGRDMSYLYSFTEEAALVDFLIDVCIDYLEKILLPVPTAETSDVHLVTHDVLGWVITDSKSFDFIGCPGDSGGNGGGNGGGNSGGNGGGNSGGNTGGNTGSTDDDKEQSGIRNPGMRCVFELMTYEQENPNFLEFLGRETKQMWNDFWGIQPRPDIPEQKPLRRELIFGNPLPGSNLCPRDMSVIVPAKPQSTWETIKGWFS